MLRLYNAGSCGRDYSSLSISTTGATSVPRISVIREGDHGRSVELTKEQVQVLVDELTGWLCKFPAVKSGPALFEGHI